MVGREQWEPVKERLWPFDLWVPGRLAYNRTKMFPLLWTGLMLFLATAIWRTGRQYAKPELGYSSRDNHREQFFARFMKKLSRTAIMLCLLSAAAVGLWSSWFWGIMFLLAIPVVGALQVVQSKKAIESGRTKSLPQIR